MPMITKSYLRQLTAQAEKNLQERLVELRREEEYLQPLVAPLKRGESVVNGANTRLDEQSDRTQEARARMRLAERELLELRDKLAKMP
jgi:hypothetical protein